MQFHPIASLSLNVMISLCVAATAFPQTDTVHHTFRFTSTTARTVSVAGSFNDWNGDIHPLERKDSVWQVTVQLVPGYYYYKFVVDGRWIPDPANEWRINDGGTDWNSIVKVGEPKRPERAKASRTFPKEKLPEPLLEENPELVELYYAAWQMAWNKIQFGTKQSGFAREFLDEGFNEMIYQWDMCFISSFAMYGRNVFPVMPSLDNFYSRQREDGYIQRVYNQYTGKPASKETADEPMVNPPLFAWVELRYYHLTGDSTRLKGVLPVLVKYYGWIEKNCRNENGKGLYYTSPLGSGMDNTPRDGVGKAGWVDMSAQQALAATCIAEIAAILGSNTIASEYARKHDVLATLINDLCWDEKEKFYFDLREDASLSSTKHIGAYWTFLSGVIRKDRIPLMVDHLLNPKEFWRPHLVPTLSADDPRYDSSGHYWLGSVWAPTNYMMVKGLEKMGHGDLADRIASNHLSRIANVYKSFAPNDEMIAFEERYGDGYKSIWECYSPEFSAPATRWDNTFYSRQDFVGWSGLGPIAMLIENVLGFDVRGSENTILWQVKRNDRHGIRQLQLRDQFVALIATLEGKTLRIDVECTKPFDLQVEWMGNTTKLKARAGRNRFIIP